MPEIILTTEINAPIERCFNLSRSIDLHMISTKRSKEMAIAGVTSGLINLNEFVTWRAQHFGLWWELTSKITEFKRPDYFVDEMTKGIFKMMKHKHSFIAEGNRITMTDNFRYQSPLGPLGMIADKLIVTAHLTRFLRERNILIKETAERDKAKS